MSFNVKGWLTHLGDNRGRLARDPRVVMRVILGVLVVANLVAALMLVQPWGASPEELEIELSNLRGELRQQQTRVDQMQSNLDKVEGARQDGDEFMRKYFLNQAPASTLINTLNEAAKQAGLAPPTLAYQEEAIEGSNNLAMVTITGNYAGNYTNLVRFLNLIDKSPRFLILDTLTAAPERNAGALNVNLRINAFRIYGAADAPTGDSTETSDTMEEAEDPGDGPVTEAVTSGPPTQARLSP